MSGAALPVRPPPATHLLTRPPAPPSYSALRFLVHFVGDVHQPLHLTDRERGGNDDFVRFENRKINLHSLWDTALITKAIREQSNYTKPLPSYVASLVWCLDRTLGVDPRC